MKFGKTINYSNLFQNHAEQSDPTVRQSVCLVLLHNSFIHSLQRVTSWNDQTKPKGY